VALKFHITSVLSQFLEDVEKFISFPVSIETMEDRSQFGNGLAVQRHWQCNI
jgi:hypothetical protein